MARSVFAGATDYKLQLLPEVARDLFGMIKSGRALLEETKRNVTEIGKMEIPPGIFPTLLIYRNRAVMTTQCLEELRPQFRAIKRGRVPAGTAKRIRDLGLEAQKIALELHSRWNRRSPDEWEGNRRVFCHLENLYADTCDLFFDYSDLTNMADRIEGAETMEVVPKWFQRVIPALERIKSLVVPFVGK